jgi:DNA-binding transcriptional MerR regulator
MPTETADLTVQEMAARSGMSKHTLRYYERIGLIAPIPRDGSSGHRRYSAETIGRIESLSCLRKSGMSLEGMRDFLRLLKRGRQAASEQKTLFETHLQQIEQEMEQLRTRKRYIEGKIAYWSAVEAGDDEVAARQLEANHILARELK